MGGFRSVLTKNYASQAIDKAQLDINEIALLKEQTERIRERILEIESLD